MFLPPALRASPNMFILSPAGVQKAALCPAARLDVRVRGRTRQRAKGNDAWKAVSHLDKVKKTHTSTR
eukprot:6074685-Pleurochrysis_carterae.AAC.1